MEKETSAIATPITTYEFIKFYLPNFRSQIEKFSQLYPSAIIGTEQFSSQPYKYQFIEKHFLEALLNYNKQFLQSITDKSSTDTNPLFNDPGLDSILKTLNLKK